MKPAARWTKDKKFIAVFSQRSAIRLNRLSLPTPCSMRARALYKALGRERGLGPGVGFVRNDRGNVAFSCGFSVGLAVVSLVANGGPRVSVGSEIEQDREMRRITLFAAGQIEGEIMTIEIGLQMDLGRETAARAPERLMFLPPFAPAAETCARTTVESNICTRSAVLLNEASVSKNSSKMPDWLNRQYRFQTLFQLPKRSGNARQETL